MKYCKNCKKTAKASAERCSVCDGPLTRSLTREELEEVRRQSEGIQAIQQKQQ